MIGGLKPYPEYKDSGVPWLGRIPAHWDISPGRAVFAEKQVKNKGLAERRVLSLSYGRIVVKPEDKLRGLVPESFETYQIVEPGDLIIRATDLQNDHTSLRVGFVRDRGIITSAYLCLKGRGALTPEFGYLLLHAYDLKKAFYGLGSGLRQNLSFRDIKYLPIVVPPPEDQKAVARFIRAMDQSTNRIGRAKSKLIALLNEHKQTVIHRAVTRGLDPDVRLKPSGVSWLDQVPYHSQVGALRRFWEVVDCKHLTVPFFDDGIPLASVSEVQSFCLDLARAKKTKAEWCRLLVAGGRAPKRGDLIYCRNTSVGACAYVDTDAAFAMGQDVCLIRSSKQNQRFLNYLLHSPFMDQQLQLLLVGATFKRVNISDIKSLTVLLPPRSEQDRICEFLDSGLVDLDALIARVRREIDLVQEYRTRLVADVGTGRLDVREASPDLPAEMEQPGVSVEADAEDESEELLEAAADHE